METVEPGLRKPGRSARDLLIVGLASGVLVAFASGCQTDRGQPSQVGAGQQPAETVARFVDAINRRDGAAFCGLLTPALAREITQEIAQNFGVKRSCARIVHGFIGQVQDSGGPRFARASVLSARELSSQQPRRTRVQLMLRDHLADDGTGRSRDLTIKDLVPLEWIGSRWRVAKLGRIVRSAFGMPVVGPTRGATR
jgi:hypothetical protein